MKRNVLEITPSQYYFLALNWMEMFHINLQEDIEAGNRERFASMTTEDLMTLYERVGPKALKTISVEELTIRAR